MKFVIEEITYLSGDKVFGARRFYSWLYLLLFTKSYIDHNGDEEHYCIHAKTREEAIERIECYIKQNNSTSIKTIKSEIVEYN